MRRNPQTTRSPSWPWRWENLPPVSNAAEDELGDDEKAEPEASASGETRRRRSRRRGRGGRDLGSNGEKVRISEGAIQASSVEEVAFGEPEADESFSAEPVHAEPIQHETTHAEPVLAGGGETEHVSSPVAEVQQRTSAAPKTLTPPPVVEEDPDRPKRTGWWQRAKASLGG